MSEQMRIGLLLIAAAGSALGQGQSGRNLQIDREYVEPSALPGVFRRNIVGLGDRLSVPGRERMLLSGSMDRQGQRAPISVVFELPGKVRVQHGAQNRVAAFDGVRGLGANALDDFDEALLETFAYDTPEALLFAAQQGTMPRILGFAFQIVGETPVFGATVDMFETTQTVLSGRQTLRIAKQFAFDTRTGLLRRVSYTTLRNGRPTTVHTELSDYVPADGQQVPRRVIRREGGVVVADIQWNAAQPQPKQNDNTFNGR